MPLHTKHLRMTPRQFRRATALIRTCCCNYDHGNCIALDNGEPCTCVQSISYSVLCTWFLRAVLPTDPLLYSELLRFQSGKKCQLCGKPIASKSNHAKYCPSCATEIRRKQDAKRKREQYRNLRK